MGTRTQSPNPRRAFSDGPARAQYHQQPRAGRAISIFILTREPVSLPLLTFNLRIRVPDCKEAFVWVLEREGTWRITKDRNVPIISNLIISPIIKRLSTSLAEMCLNLNALIFCNPSYYAPLISQPLLLLFPVFQNRTAQVQPLGIRVFDSVQCSLEAE